MYLGQILIINVNMIIIDCVVTVLTVEFVIIYTTHMQVTNVLVLTSDYQTRKNNPCKSQTGSISAFSAFM